MAIAVTRGANSRLARPMTALASWIRLGTPRQAAAKHRRDRRITAEADDRRGLEPADQRPGLGEAEAERGERFAPARSGCARAASRWR